MTLLTGPAIAEAVQRGDITIDPFDPAHIGPNSYDVRLGDRLLTYKTERITRESIQQPRCQLDRGPSLERRHTPLDMRWETPTHEIPLNEKGFVLKPGVLYLGTTVEKAGSKVFAPMLEGRSSVARLGLEVHISAGFGDVGFESNWTLELTVVQPLRIYPNVRIAQVSFHTTAGERQLYTGKYTDQEDGPVSSRMHDDRPPGRARDDSQQDRTTSTDQPRPETAEGP